MGRPADIVTAKKEFFLLLPPSSDIADSVGQTIRVTGELRNEAILADQLEVNLGAG